MFLDKLKGSKSSVSVGEQSEPVKIFSGRTLTWSVDHIAAAVHGGWVHCTCHFSIVSDILDKNYRLVDKRNTWLIN